jgi:hypothetical protein
MEPDASLNFEEGEVIYENSRVTPGFYIFEIYAADGAPSLQWMADNWNWWDIPRQF